MADAVTQIQIDLQSHADTSGVEAINEAIATTGQQSADVAKQAGEAAAQVQEISTVAGAAAQAVEEAAQATARMGQEADRAGNDYDALFSDLKRGIAETLQAGGADTKFISHVVDEFERLNQELQATGATGEVVAQRIAQMEQQLVAAAAAEEKRISQLKINFEMALHEKDVQEEAAALQRRRREEDQLAMEQEGIELRRTTELLEQQIIAKIKAERISKENIQTQQSMGKAAKGAGQDIGQALLLMGQFADDAQYGLKAVVNNIPQLAAAFGAGAGLAGAIGIASVALNLLWEKFGHAKEAKQETDRVTDSIEAMHDSLARASDAANDLFKADLDKYVEQVERATTAWHDVAAGIQKVIAYNNELARVQTEIANQQLEIDRQNALVAARDADERKRINTEFDNRKTMINDAAGLAEARRNLEAQQYTEEMLRKQAGNVEGVKNDAEGRVFSNQQDQKNFVDTYGGQSDQARRVDAAAAAQYQLQKLQAERDQVEQKLRDMDANPPGVMDAGSWQQHAAERAGLQSQSDRLREKIDVAAQDRDVTHTGIEGDREALKTGKGLTFTDLEKEAKAKGGSPEGIGMTKLYEDAVQRQDQLIKQSEEYNKALNDATQNLAKIRTEIADSEREMVKKKLQVEAAALKDTADFAKAGTTAALAEQEAAEKERKRDREERARKLENDAKAMDQQGLYAGAAKNRNDAALLKLPDDATPEQRRALDLANKQRLEDAAKKSAEAQIKKDSQDLGDKTGNLARNLGAAGKDLKHAAEKLSDGANEKELEALTASLKELAPLLLQKFAGQEKKFSQMLKEIELLKSQIRNQRIRS